MRERIMEEIGEDALLMDGFDDCIIGYVEQFGRPPITLYDRDKVIQRLMDDFAADNPHENEAGLSIMAWEWYEYNMIGGYVGEYTPAFAVIL